MQELHSMFLDMAILVSEQGDMIDRIESSVDRPVQTPALGNHANLLERHWWGAHQNNTGGGGRGKERKAKNRVEVVVVVGLAAT